MLTVFAFLVLCLLCILAVAAFIALALWPGRAARSRGHPQADAINVLSWGGLLLTAGIGWLVALTWAYAKPGSGAPDGESLHERIGRLEAEVAGLRGAKS